MYFKYIFILITFRIIILVYDIFEKLSKNFFYSLIKNFIDNTFMRKL